MMMARLLLLAGAAAGKELSFGRDGVELFRRVFDAADLARLRTAWDAVEANETIESEALEQGCVAAVARTQRDGARRTVVAARLDRSVQGDTRGPIRWDEPLVDGQRRPVEVVRTPLDDVTGRRAALQVWPGTFLERDRRALRISAANASWAVDPPDTDAERLDAALDHATATLAHKTVTQRAGDVLVLRPEVWRRRRAHRDPARTRTLVCVVVKEGAVDVCEAEPCGATPLGRLVGVLGAAAPPADDADGGALWTALRNGTRRAPDDARAAHMVAFVRRVRAIPEPAVLVEVAGPEAPRLSRALEHVIRHVVVAPPTAAALACAELSSDAVCVSSVDAAVAAVAGLAAPIVLAVHGDSTMADALLTALDAEQVWLFGDRVSDQLKRAAEARTCAHAPPRGAPLHHIRAAVACPSRRYGREELRWTEGRVAEDVFGAVGSLVAHDLTLTAPCTGQEVMEWPGWSETSALRRFTDAVGGSDVEAHQRRACRAWDALCSSPALDDHGGGVAFNACYGLRGGYGPPRAAACVVHAGNRTSLATCAGRHVAHVGENLSEEASPPPLLDTLCHVGFGVTPSVSAWLHANVARTVIALAAPSPGVAVDFGELGALTLLQRLHPRHVVRAYSLNAPEAVVAAARRVRCDAVYVDLSTRHDHSAMASRYFGKVVALLRSNASELWLPRLVEAAPGAAWKRLAPHPPKAAHCVNYAALEAGVVTRRVGNGPCASVPAPNWVGGGLDAYVYRGDPAGAAAAPPQRMPRPPSPRTAPARFVMVACDHAADPRRATEALVAMASAVASAKRGAALHFYVLCNGAAADELARRMPTLLALADEERITVRVTLGDIKWPAYLEEGAASHFKPCACVRLFLGELLPGDWNAGQVLYIDTDVLFVADPELIYADAVAALGSTAFVAAAAEHGDLISSSFDAYYNATDLPRAWADDGANTGVLALDLDRSAAANLSAWLVQTRATLDGLNRTADFGDQGWLNALLGAVRRHVPPAGRLPCALNFRTDFCHHDFLDAERCADTPQLLHAPRGALHLDSIYATPAFRLLFVFLRAVLHGRDRGAARFEALAAYGELLDGGAAAAAAPRCAGVAGVAAAAVRGWFPGGG